MSTFLTWVNAFVWTNALEAPVWAWLLRRVPGPWWQPLALMAVCNLVTHPAFTAWQLVSRPSGVAILVAEGVVASTEGLLCGAWLARGNRTPRPWLAGFAAAFAANLCSYGLALLARAL